MSSSSPRFRLELVVQPRARRSEIVGWQGAALKIRVSAPPVEGAANAALIELLAKIVGVARSRVILVRGESSRTKLVEIEASPEICRLRLEQAVTGSGSI